MTLLVQHNHIIADLYSIFIVLFLVCSPLMATGSPSLPPSLPSCLPPLSLRPPHEVPDILCQSEWLNDGPHSSTDSRVDHGPEGGLSVPVTPNGCAVGLVKLLLTGVRPGEGADLRGSPNDVMPTTMLKEHRH